MTFYADTPEIFNRGYPDRLLARGQKRAV